MSMPALNRAFYNLLNITVASSSTLLPEVKVTILHLLKYKFEILQLHCFLEALLEFEYLCCLSVFTADDKAGMGGSAEARTRTERAEATGEAGQRGETAPRRIETKRNISSST